MKLSLKEQLEIVSLLLLLILSTSILFVIPKSLGPFFEQTIYSYLNKPLQMYNEKNSYNSLNIVFIQKRNNLYSISNNKNDLDIDNYENIFSLIIGDYGKFRYNGKIYYYSTSKTNHMNYIDTINIALTDDSYVKDMQNDLKINLLPILSIIFVLTFLLLLLWINTIIRKTNKLKEKILNINNSKYNVKDNNYLTDEFSSLNESVDNVKEIILKQDKYKSELLQNVSHDFKTPITVIKSYIEAYHDGVENSDNTINVIEQQTNRLEHQVKILLDLNKITYMETVYENNESIVLDDIVNTNINNYKFVNKNIKFTFNTDHSVFDGNANIWEPIIDNLLNNFTRYAKTEIKIIIKNKKISFYNDGDKITNIDNLFNPFVKGKNGRTGLGLSIVKRNCDLVNYNIEVKNKNGVIFTIKKN